MNFKPYIPNQDEWISSFNKSKKATKKYYTLKKRDKNNSDSIKLVTPTAQVVQQAKMELKRKYDDLMEDSQKPIKRSIKRKKKQCIARNRKGRK